MTADLVQARRPFVGRVAGNRILVRAGDLYRGDDAVVGAFPDKFREPKVHASPAPAPERSEPTPEPSAEAVKEFNNLKLTTDADVVPLSEGLAKLDEATLAALYAEHKIEEDTPEAALVALAATRYSEPKASEADKPKATTKPKAAPKKATRTRAAPKKASASTSK